MNPLLAPAVFGEKRGVEAGVKQSSSESWNGREKSTRRSSRMPPRSRYRPRFGARYPSRDSIIHSDGWRGYNGLVDMGYQKHLGVHP